MGMGADDCGYVVVGVGVRRLVDVGIRMNLFFGNILRFIVGVPLEKPYVSPPRVDPHWAIVSNEGVWVNEINDFEVAWLKCGTRWKRMAMEDAKRLYPDERGK